MRTRGTVGDLLIDAYQLHVAGRKDDAGQRLLGAWSMGMDALSTEQDARVALRLLRRLGFTTDDPEGWAVLPDPLTIDRAGGGGLSWTVDRDVAESLARRFDLGPVQERTIAKADELAFIAGYGEAEVIVESPSSGPRSAQVE